MSVLLAVNGLVLAYGKIVAVRGVDLSVDAGRVVCLIGANGAGKTTILRGISGLLRPKEGSIVFRGEVMSRLSAHRIARMGVVLVPEGRQLFTRMSVAENLRIGAFLVKDRREVQRGGRPSGDSGALSRIASGRRN